MSNACIRVHVCLNIEHHVFVCVYLIIIINYAKPFV
jgi:hypothetical protein